MQTHLKVLFLVLVPVLGLISCSKDMPHVDDPWVMREPTIESPDQPTLQASAANGQTLSANSVLNLSRSPWKTLSVKSHCELAGKSYDAEFMLEHIDVLPMRSVWPSDLWSSQPESELQKSECSFKFMTITEISSTQEFSIEHVKLASFVRLKPEAKANLEKAMSGAVNAASETIKMFGKNFSDDAQITLSCAGKSAPIEMRAAQRSADFLRSLMTDLDLRGQQTCFLLFAEPVSPEKVSNFELTPEFKLNFPSVPLTINVSSPLSALTKTPVGMFWYSIPFVHIALTNSSSTPTFVRVPTVNSVDFEVVMQALVNEGCPGTRRGELCAKKLGEGLLTAVSGDLAGFTGNDGTITYQINPGQTLTLELVTTRQYDIVSGYIGASLSSGAMANARFVGVRFRLDLDFVVTQLDSLDAATGKSLFSLATSVKKKFPHSVVFDVAREDIGENFDSWPITEYP